MDTSPHREDPTDHEPHSGAAHAAPRRNTPFFVYLKKGLTVLVILLVLFFGLYAATASALPGSVFYTVKVHVLERIMPVFRIGAAADGSYQLTLMERRVNELIEMDNRGMLDEERFNKELAQIETHRRTLTDLIAKHEDGALSRGESLTLLRSFVSYARAAEEILESGAANSDMEERIEDTRREIENFYEDKIDQFVVKSDSAEVKGYLDAELNTVASLSEGREMSRDLEDDVEDALDEVGDSLTEVDVAGAITAASEAVRYLEVTDVLSEFEQNVSQETTPGTEETQGVTEEGTVVE